ncbi:TPA: thymidylate synthase [Streptococcus suis]
MQKVDKIYKDLVNTIIDEGRMETGNIRAHYADGTPAYTKQILNWSAVFKPEDGVPILHSKRVAMKSFTAEIDWIWRLMSNDVNELVKLGSSVWNEWKKEDGTILKAYGWQLANKKRLMKVREDWINTNANGDFVEKELNQVEFILHEIMHNPNSRRIMTDLYSVGEIQEMALEPCVFLTNWQVEGDTLHLIVTQRSSDVALGLPSNFYEYSLLHHRIAQVTGKKVGNLYWNIFNAHIYDRHIPLLKEQVNAKFHIPEKAEFIMPEDLDYFNTSLKEVKVSNYKHNGVYRYEIAI